MATSQGAAPTTAPRAGSHIESTYDDVERGFGWTVFAGTMLLLASVVTGLWAIAAFANSSYFREDGLVAGNLTTWGVVLLCVATVQGVTGFMVLARSKFAAVVGLIIAGVSVTANLVSIGAYPLWSVIAITIDGLVIYALCAYGFKGYDAQ